MTNKFFSFRGPDQQKNPSTGEVKRKTLRSEDLFRGEREIIICHGDQEYRLQITKAGKLILNK